MRPKASRSIPRRSCRPCTATSSTRSTTTVAPLPSASASGAWASFSLPLVPSGSHAAIPVISIGTGAATAAVGSVTAVASPGTVSPAAMSLGQHRGLRQTGVVAARPEHHPQDPADHCGDDEQTTDHHERRRPPLVKTAGRPRPDHVERRGRVIADDDADRLTPANGRRAAGVRVPVVAPSPRVRAVHPGCAGAPAVGERPREPARRDGVARRGCRRSRAGSCRRRAARREGRRPSAAGAPGCGRACDGSG